MTVRYAFLCALLCGATTLSAQLSGSYTIGGSNPDYATIAAAVDALNGQGASGHVTFHIRPGTYTGQYGFGEIGGTPGEIVFRSAENDASSVILEHAASNADNDFIVRIDGTDGLRFEHLTFRPLDAGHGRAIHFFNAIDGLSITDCVFHGQNAGFKALVHGDQNMPDVADRPQSVSIQACTLLGGRHGMELDFLGMTAGLAQDITISHNTLIDQVSTGITLIKASGHITDNRITTTVGDWFTGIRTLQFTLPAEVARNTIHAVATNDCTGIEYSNTVSMAPHDNMVANNMVQVEGSGTTWGIAVFNLWGTAVVHNSVLVTGGDPEGSYAFHHLSNFPDGQDLLLRNNIFSNRSGGPALNVNEAGNLATEDHNAFFSTGSALARIGGTDHATLAAYQSATGQGNGSVHTDPVFPLQPDLHMNSCVLDGLGQYFLHVHEDIDHDPRTDPACDMGADEFTFSSGTLPLPGITVQAAQLPYELGFNATFNSHEWNTSATTATIMIDEGGIYTCDVTDVNGCSYTMQVEVTVEGGSTGVEAHTLDQIQLFPNPVTDRLFIHDLPAYAPYMVLDAAGQMVRQGRLTPDAPLHVGGLAPGMYLLHLPNGTSTRYARFVKQ